MSVDAKTGPVAAAGGTDDAVGLDVAGLVFARLSVVPALLAMAWLLAGLVFLCAGWFRPVPVTALAVILAVPVVWFGVRAVPGLPGRAAAALPGDHGKRTPWWPLAAVGVIAAGFLAVQVMFHTQFVIITRDPGAYFQFATWLFKHGSLPIPPESAAFGGTHGGLVDLGSYATYQQANGSVVLQFMAGMPMVLAGAMWAGGYHAALLMGPVLGTLAVVTFAGLTARLVGARWAPLAALMLAVALPMMFTSRSTYSEPLAMILFLGGLALVLDSLRSSSSSSDSSSGSASASLSPSSSLSRSSLSAARVAAGLGGLALGITVLVRIDGVSDILPVIPFCGALFVRRRPQARWLAAGLAVGTVIGVAEGLVFSWPYLMQTNRSSVIPLAGLLAVVIAGTVAGTWYFRRRTELPQWWGWLPNAALAGSFVIVGLFAVRSRFQTVNAVDDLGHHVRTYAELSLHWVDWYLGAPVIVAATVGAGLLARACLRGRGGDWALPLMVLSWATVIFLYRPAITPDQPWASRRMVPEVIPAFVLLSVWALARGAACLKQSRSGGGLVRAAGALRPALVGVGALALVVPAVIASWGLHLSHSGLAANGLAGKRDFQGELTAMNKLCQALPPKAAVMFTNPTEGPQMLQGIRGMCGVPAAEVAAWDSQGQRVLSDQGLVTFVKSLTVEVKRAGYVPVILSNTEGDLSPYRHMGTVRHVFTLHTTRDPQIFHGVPKDPMPQLFDVWMWHPAP